MHYQKNFERRKQQKNLDPAEDFVEIPVGGSQFGRIMMTRYLKKHFA